MMTNLTHEDNTNNNKNEDVVVVVESNTEINVSIDMNRGMVSFDHDTSICHDELLIIE